MSLDLDLDAIGALTSFSVGTLDGRDPMMVIEIAIPDERRRDVRHQMPVAMTVAHARELAEALLLAAEASLMGPTENEMLN
jgi:hypothetical protein